MTRPNLLKGNESINSGYECLTENIIIISILAYFPNDAKKNAFCK